MDVVVSSAGAGVPPHPLAPALGADYTRFWNTGVFHTGVPVPTGPPLGPLAETIRRDGPVPYSEFVASSLFGGGGYYARNVELTGIEDGALQLRDFITCPEASPLFGRTLAEVFLTYVDRCDGRSEATRVFELGAGTGAFARAFLQGVRDWRPELFERMRYVFVERSPVLADCQRAAMEKAFPSGAPVDWHRGSAGEVVPPAGAFVFSNEMLDCWPFERVARRSGVVEQLFVDVEDGAWVERWAPATPAVIAYVERHAVELAEGLEEPLLLATESWLGRLASGMERGCVCFVDYGAIGPITPFLLGLDHVGRFKRAPVRQFGPAGVRERIAAHRAAERNALGVVPYERPGEVDLTCSVDFGPVRSIFGSHGWRLDHCDTQEALLLRAGFPGEVARARTRWRAARSWEELSREAAAISYGFSFVSIEMERWFFGLVATKGVEKPLLPAGAPTVASARIQLLVAARSDRLALPVPEGTARVRLEDPTGEAPARTEPCRGGVLRLSIYELVRPGLRIVTEDAVLYDLSEPETQALILALKNEQFGH